MKLTIAWNVWNNYLDTALGSEIVRCENDARRTFDALHLVSQGGYPEPPSPEYARYLDAHVPVAYPEGLPLLEVHAKFKGVFRVLEGMQRAFRDAAARGDDFVVVTNGDAWFLDVVKLRSLLQSERVQRAAVSMRVGWLTGLAVNFGNRVPLMDDHFMIFNVAECTRLGVFDYDHSARFFRSHFGHMGGMHYLLMCFLNERVPAGAFHVYSALEDTLNHYGDFTGWNLLPWQYQPSFGFLHANAAQVPSLHRLRAAFLHDLGYTRYPLVRKYWEETAPDPALFRRRRGVLVYKKPVRRALREALYWLPYRCYTACMRPWYARQYAALPASDPARTTLEYFDAMRHIKPYWLTQ